MACNQESFLRFAISVPATALAVISLTLGLAAGGCETSTGEPDAPDAQVEPLHEADHGCPSLFFQEDLPEYRVEITAAEWEQLEYEFMNRPSPETPELVENPYHPIALTFNGEPIADAMIRLKGDSSWWQAITLDDHPKMQFVIAFNEIDKNARFRGVRKVELDMPRDDGTFLRQRLALYYLRTAGVPAQCANNARLFINGAYYGLYTNLERLDKEFLQRQFAEQADGDLWDGGREIKTNEDSFSWDRIDALWAVTSIGELAALADLDAAVALWANDAMLPNEDGYYNGRANYFLYDHPTRGFVWLPHDLDATFDYLPAAHSPVYPTGEGRDYWDRKHWAIVLSNDTWMARYRADLALARDAYDVEEMQRLVLAWSAQIDEAARQDPMKPFSNEVYEGSITLLHRYLAERAEVVDRWLDCFQSGGADTDGDGFTFCKDCDDDEASRHPGALEVCNGHDDNCDGLADEEEGGEQCS